MVLSAGIAYAYYTSHGTGSGAASTIADVEDIKVAPSAAVDPIPAMWPGDTAKAYGNFRNPNLFPVAVEQVTATVDWVEGSDGLPVDPSVCGADDFHITPARPDSAYRIPAAPSSGAFGFGQWGAASSTVPQDNVWVTFKQRSDHNQDGCQGTRVHLIYSAVLAD